jgi:hypothetical protein
MKFDLFLCYFDPNFQIKARTNHWYQKTKNAIVFTFPQIFSLKKHENAAELCKQMSSQIKLCDFLQ